ncbi:hypothetical protein [Pleionea sediminis]|uniref:hypothetical protein n=1 Tax=Pleionea sediminis TaxID=2569479 RepID=UPI0011859E46|nr:hypothetical protein [Pleionea sediminis]
MHKVRRILEVIAERLTPIKDQERVVDQIQLATSLVPDSLPCLAIEFVSDRPIDSVKSYGVADHQVSFSVSAILVDDITEPVLLNALDIQALVHKYLQLPNELITPDTIVLSYLGLEAPQVNIEGERTVCSLMSQWQLNYRARVDDVLADTTN